jgi:hypothetical protein
MNVENTIAIACTSARFQQWLILCVRTLVLFDLHDDISLSSHFLYQFVFHMAKYGTNRKGSHVLKVDMSLE